MSKQDEVFFNLPGAGRHIGVKPQTVRYWIIAGKCKATMVDGHWIIKKSDLEEADRAARSGPRPGRRGKRGTLVPAVES